MDLNPRQDAQNLQTETPQQPEQQDTSQIGRISSFANYQARMEAQRQRATASSPVNQGPQQPQNQPPVQQPERSQSPQGPSIQPQQAQPQQAPDLAQQVQALQAQLASMRLQQQPPIQQQPQPQNLAPGGMAQPQQAPAQTQDAPPDWSNPAVKKQWREKLVSDPVSTMVEMVQQLQRQGESTLAQQVQEQLQQYVAPIQQHVVGQAAQQYIQQRANEDQGFQTVTPYFNYFLDYALSQRPDLPLNQQTFSTIEQVARIQAQQDAQAYGWAQPQQGYQQQIPQGPQQYNQGYGQQPPYQERPGASAGFQPQATRQYQISPEINRLAQMSGLSPQEYARRVEEMSAR